MPKELIHSRYDWDTETTQLRIDWTREHSHVQVATIAPDGQRLTDSGPEANGWFIQLDRAGINRAIATLRRARDQAFGKDE